MTSVGVGLPATTASFSSAAFSVPEAQVGVVGRGTKLNGQPCKTASGLPSLKEALLYATTPEMFRAGFEASRFGEVPADRADARVPDAGRAEVLVRLAYRVMSCARDGVHVKDVDLLGACRALL